MLRNTKYKKIAKLLTYLTHYHWFTFNVYQIKESKSVRVLLRHINCLNVFQWHRVICTTHQLHTRSSCIGPSHTPDRAYSASVLVQPLLHLFPNSVRRQQGSDVDCWESQVWWNESWSLPVQKANCIAVSVCKSTVLLEDKELARDRKWQVVAA